MSLLQVLLLHGELLDFKNLWMSTKTKLNPSFNVAIDYQKQRS